MHKMFIYVNRHTVYKYIICHNKSIRGERNTRAEFLYAIKT